MSEDIERNLGEQPLAKIMEEYDLKPSNLVAASEEQMTHKMVSRAIKGRRLTPNVKHKILYAVNKATGQRFTLKHLFNY